MNYKFPTEMSEQTQPTVNVGLDPECTAAITRARQAGIFVQFGLSPDLRGQILAAATEPSIKEFCPNDITRFANDETGAKWAGKGRAMTSLINKAGQLLAYGWAGSEANQAIPTAPITTAYRVTEAGSVHARHVRRELDPSFRIGYFLGKIVIGTAEYYGAKPAEISLETWESNTRAIGLYKDLGFVLRAKMPEERGRPTLHSIGHTINGHAVYEYPRPDTGIPEQRVFDTRCHYSLGSA